MDGRVSSHIKADDMLVLAFSQSAPEGYVAAGADDSTRETVYYREGSVPQKTGMSLVEFSRLISKGQGTPCPV